MSYQNQSTPAPSKVLHIRNASSEDREVDLNIILPYLSTFGTCVYVVTMPRLQQAIVEMDSLESAQKAFDVAKGNMLDLREQRYFIHYSKSASINREPSFRRSMYCNFFSRHFPFITILFSSSFITHLPTYIISIILFLSILIFVFSHQLLWSTKARRSFLLLYTTHFIPSLWRLLSPS